MGRQTRTSGRSTRARGDGSPELLTGFHPVREALRARRRPLVGLRVRADSRHPGLDELRALAETAGIPTREESGDALPAPGIGLEVGPLPILDLESLLIEVKKRDATQPTTLVALDGVEDPQNLGAIARVADGSGAQGLILTQRHAPPLSAAVSRASAGAIEWLPVARVPNLARALEALKREAFWVFAADLDSGCDLYELTDTLLGSDRVVVLGAEGRGLRPGVRRRVDQCVRIPLGGHVDSLNVSAAAAVLLFELRRRLGVLG